MTSAAKSSAAKSSAAKSSAADAVLRALRRTRQIRDFRPGPVPDELLEQILDIAHWSGSATNRQPWTFIVIRERKRLDHLAGLNPNAGHLARAPLAIAIAMPGEKPEWESFDEGRVAERILIAAETLGLGAGIGWSVPSKRPATAEYLGLPAPAYVRTFISIGYPTEAAAAPKSPPGQARKPLADVVRYERFA